MSRFSKVDIKPISVNICWQGKRFKTDKYKKWRRDINFILPNIKPPESNYLKVDIIFGFSSKLNDIDNCLKSFLDSLKDKYGIDDRYIYELNVKKEIVKKNDEFIKFKIEKL